VLWLLEELQLPYEIKFYARDPITMLAPPELKAIHPLGKSPVITDGTTTMAESGAIIEYLLKKHGKGRLRPQNDSDDELRFIYWLHYAEGTLMPPLLLSLIFSVMPKKLPIFLRPVGKLISEGVMSKLVRPSLKANLDFVNDELSKSEWFAGAEFSAADVQMSFPLEAASSRGGLESRPNISRFLKKIHERPAYKKALQKGGPYSMVG
jgi:glutathione S-transferase